MEVAATAVSFGPDIRTDIRTTRHTPLGASTRQIDEASETGTERFHHTSETRYKELLPLL